MPISLVSHVTDQDSSLRLWAGLAGFSADEQLVWRINGSISTPITIRQYHWPIRNGLHFQSLVVEFHNLPTDRIHTVELQAGDERTLRNFRTRINGVPAKDGQTFNLLLLSCFDNNMDKGGKSAKILSQLVPKPDWTILAGDQVYLDLPPLLNFVDDTPWLENQFYKTYYKNWFNGSSNTNPQNEPVGYPSVLTLAPVAMLPDDHEFWNNAPALSPWIGNTFTAQGRKRWWAAATKAYEAFQLSARSLGSACKLQQPPLSILMLDTRTQRNAGGIFGNTTDNAGDLLGHSGQQQALEEWASKLVESANTATPQYGVLVTGQSLFREPAGFFEGKTTDYELANYSYDYEFILQQIERVSAAGLPVLCLTGDVHWGRVSCAQHVNNSYGKIYEFISSPTSLCQYSNKRDMANVLLNHSLGVLRDLQLTRDYPFPEPPPTRFGTRGLYTTTTLNNFALQNNKPLQGDMGLMLSFSTVGRGLDVIVTYIPFPDTIPQKLQQRSMTLSLRPIV